MQRPVVVLRNGEPIPWRPLNAQERAKDFACRRAAVRMYKKLGERGMRLNTKRQLHAVLLVCPDPGDYLKVTGVPEDYDEVWVRWDGSMSDAWNDSIYHMEIEDARA